jgi:hypothetical protein
MKSYYKIVCEEVNLVLLVKRMPVKDQQSKYKEIKYHIQNSSNPIDLEAYKKSILLALLFKPEEFFKSLPKDIDERSTIISSVYETIINVYPHFSIDIVCADVNRAEILEDLGGILPYPVDKRPSKSKAGSEPASNPDTSNSAEFVKYLEASLKNGIIGQDSAVSILVDSMKLIATGLYDRASFFFIGPTGVGKTELAKLLGAHYSGDFWKINCAEYASAHEYAKLIGSPPGYIGHSENSVMYEKSSESNRWVILFDEIEKAHPKFYDFLLSLLDDGTCTDNMGRELDFSESIFIFTSNAGVSDLKLGRKLGFGNEVIGVSSCGDQILESVKKKFPAEFLNRLDNYIFFNALSKDNVRDITKIALNTIPINKTKGLVDYIVKNGYSEEYGARNINRFIKNNVATKIADAILNNQEPTNKNGLYSGRIVNNDLVIGTKKNHAAEG